VTTREEDMQQFVGEMNEGHEDEDLKEDDVLYCFLDAQRPCSAECMAYQTRPPPNKHLPPVQARCVLVRGMETASRGVNILAMLGAEGASDKAKERIRAKVRDQDAQREAAFNGMPPKPGD